MPASVAALDIIAVAIAPPASGGAAAIALSKPKSAVPSVRHIIVIAATPMSEIMTVFHCAAISFLLMSVPR